MKYAREYLTIDQAREKAPVGATHYMPPSDEWYGCFIREASGDKPSASMVYPHQNEWVVDPEHMKDNEDHILYGRATRLN